MIIAVDTEELKEEPGNFLHECLQRIIPSSLQHRFILLSKGNGLSTYKAYNNCQVILVKKKRQISLLNETNSLLKQQNADILITSNPLLAMFAKIKTGLVSASLQHFFPDQPNSFLRTSLQKKSLKKASIIYTAWAQDKVHFAHKYNILKNKIKVIHFGLTDIPKTLDFEQQQIVQAKYAEGNAYFLVAQSNINTGDLLVFLKAFSIFKKKLKSTLKLLLYCNNAENDKEQFDKLLKDYRFKSDVSFINQNDASLPELFSSAYAAIFNNIKIRDVDFALQAIAAGAAVVCCTTAIAKEIFDDAALFYNEFVPAEIAGSLITVYKDEQLKKTLSVKQIERQAIFSWDQSATDMLQGIENALH